MLSEHIPRLWSNAIRSGLVLCLLSFWERRLHAPNTFYTTICLIWGNFCFLSLLCSPIILWGHIPTAAVQQEFMIVYCAKKNYNLICLFLWLYKHRNGYFHRTMLLTWVLNSFTTTEYVILVAAKPSNSETTMESECKWWEILLSEKEIHLIFYHFPAAAEKTGCCVWHLPCSAPTQGMTYLPAKQVMTGLMILWKMYCVYDNPDHHISLIRTLRSQARNLQAVPVPQVS